MRLIVIISLWLGYRETGSGSLTLLDVCPFPLAANSIRHEQKIVTYSPHVPVSISIQKLNGEVFRYWFPSELSPVKLSAQKSTWNTSMGYLSKLSMG